MEYDWKLREVNRFLIGEYKRLPWVNETWRLSAPRETFFHFAHVSRDDPSKIAYTPTERHGIEDRQVRMKPGKYLNKYFSSLLSQEEIAKWAGKFAGANETHKLKFARTPDEIEFVYLNGPDSCMSHAVSNYDSSIHPVRVYGAGDLAVAYIERNEGITARCICWPEKKVYRPIYGDVDRLESALESAGYKEGPINGARLLLVEEGSGFVCPHLDGGYSVDVIGKYLKIGSGEYSAQSTNGLIATTRCERCGEYCDEDNFYTVNDENWCEGCVSYNAFNCECCETICPDDEANTVNNDECWCDNCVRNEAFCCTSCHNIYSENGIEIDGETYCERCAEREAFYCDHCEEHHIGESVKVENEIWCQYCADTCAFICDECSEYFGKEMKKTKDDENLCRYCYEAGEKEELEDE